VRLLLLRARREAQLLAARTPQTCGADGLLPLLPEGRAERVEHEKGRCYLE
jgi:hypothetical protein